ncbi:hypothetical protein LZ31DRAFT_550604 [Colletotrichum somersetense]|nr:hypothetical protein LZ31DRAFT_550604 [Colletotrichum somersetense]
MARFPQPFSEQVYIPPVTQEMQLSVAYSCKFRCRSDFWLLPILTTMFPYLWNTCLYHFGLVGPRKYVVRNSEGEGIHRPSVSLGVFEL